MSDRRPWVLAVLTAGVLTASAPRCAGGLIVVGSRTATDVGGFDEITFRLAGFTGADAAFRGTDTVTELSGTLQITGPFGAAMSVPGPPTTWRLGTTPNGGGNGNNVPPNTYANFNVTIPSDFARSPDTPTPTSLTGAWFAANEAQALRPVDTTVGPRNDGFDQTLVARVYVSPGADVRFFGKYTSDAVAGAAVSFTSIAPEPATAAGAVPAAAVAGLLRRRRRRRPGPTPAA